jgi:hypothetical protein
MPSRTSYEKIATASGHDVATPAITRATSRPQSVSHIFSLGNKPFAPFTHIPEYLKDPKMQVGDKIEVLLHDGSKHPELAGRSGRVAAIYKNGALVIEVDGYGACKANELWWRRLAEWE